MFQHFDVPEIPDEAIADVKKYLQNTISRQGPEPITPEGVRKILRKYAHHQYLEDDTHIATKLGYSEPIPPLALEWNLVPSAWPLKISTEERKFTIQRFSRLTPHKQTKLVQLRARQPTLNFIIKTVLYHRIRLVLIQVFDGNVAEIILGLVDLL